MRRVVRPVAETVSGRELGRDVAAATAGATYAPDTAGSTGSTSSADTTDATDSARATGSADTTHAAYATGPTGSANATYSADSAYATGATSSADTTNAAYSTDSADTTDAANTTHATDSAPGNGVSIEVVEVVDIDAVVTPPTAPAPTAAPKGAHHHPGSEGDRRTGSVVTPSRIVERGIRICRWTVDGRRRIGWDVDNLRIRRFDDDNALLFDHFRFYDLLRSSLERSFFLGFSAHALNRIHHVGLLRQKGVAQIGGPLNILP
jgi:hypothetical protein